MKVEKDYSFDTDGGRATLADLFHGRSQLLVYHFMFGPDYAAGCPSCSAIADGFDGFAEHLAIHDVMLSAVSRTYLKELPGMSAFGRADGAVHHTYSTYARGLDALWGMYPWLDRAPLAATRAGRGGSATTNMAVNR